MMLLVFLSHNENNKFLFFFFKSHRNGILYDLVLLRHSMFFLVVLNILFDSLHFVFVSGVF